MKTLSSPALSMEMVGKLAARLRSLREGGAAFYLKPDCREADLAKELDVGLDIVMAYFKFHNVTFDFYINKLRVEYAVELMEVYPRMSLLLVCKMSGFGSSMLNFCRYFFCLRGQTLKQFCIERGIHGYKERKSNVSEAVEEISAEDNIDYTSFVLA